MRKIFAVVFFILTTCGFAFAQTSFPELEIAKEISLLRSTHRDVIRILREFDRDEDEDKDLYQSFYSDRAMVKVSFSTGDCSKESTFWNLPDWNVPEQTATKIVISFDDTTKLEDLGLNLSGFKKKLEDEDEEDSKEYVYYNEKAGIIVLTDEGEVEKIILHPPKKQIGYLCVNENNSEILSREMSFIDSIIQKESYCILKNFPSSVTELNLRTNGVFGCKDENCADAKKEISVGTTAIDPENDVLIYNYAVTGGKIVGVGAQVVWDLASAAPGIYQITAGVDDGCGICGETKARKILLKENSYEIIPPAKITELILDKTELIAACPAGRLKRKLCPSGSCGVSVSTVVGAPDGENLTFKYKVSGGEIVGRGDRVIWDLAGLKPGKYSIMVSVSDDGAVFGSPETATVEIKENQYCVAAKR